MATMTWKILAMIYTRAELYNWQYKENSIWMWIMIIYQWTGATASWSRRRGDCGGSTLVMRLLLLWYIIIIIILLFIIVGNETRSEGGAECLNWTNVTAAEDYLGSEGVGDHNMCRWGGKHIAELETILRKVAVSQSRRRLHFFLVK